MSTIRVDHQSAGEKSAKLAVLIDADNAQPSMAGALLAEIAKYGTPFVKRAYGDWTGTSLKGWKERLLENSIQPVQQFSYTQGKNSTDAAMVIDAMDLLYTQRFDGFCLVSSDSDFTRLASRIREAGLVVYGFGERKTPRPLVTACDKFIYIDNLAVDVDFATQPSTPTRKEPPAAKQSIPDAVFIRKAIQAVSDDDGWANVARLGSLITQWQPDFDPRSFGFEKLGLLLNVYPFVETTQRFPREGKPPVLYVRLKWRVNK
ncbi:hypothetical protein CCM_08313 [Cordyceps militaris CM01]|uniref:HTH OST-type domain-containing protein n=1 Tax=Cordyceps militaris (strain CM01) TaxID=983644 RepID=G3JTC3_CORMM|nr:uncharacterized protein CCM_08313 [Cordyceps militaris CM01]EGX88270.1 hypothetical protein CCM_08313 [Cordyceps militaris CM01]